MDFFIENAINNEHFCYDFKSLHQILIMSFELTKTKYSKNLVWYIKNQNLSPRKRTAGAQGPGTPGADRAALHLDHSDSYTTSCICQNAQNFTKKCEFAECNYAVLRQWSRCEGQFRNSLRHRCLVRLTGFFFFYIQISFFILWKQTS